jgi:hypothetical protein
MADLDLKKQFHKINSEDVVKALKTDLKRLMSDLNSVVGV